MLKLTERQEADLTERQFAVGDVGGNKVIYYKDADGTVHTFYGGAGAGLMSFVLEVLDAGNGPGVTFTYVQNPLGLPAPTVTPNWAAPYIEISIAGFSFDDKPLIPFHPRSGGAANIKTPVSFGGTAETLRINLQPLPGEFEPHHYAYAIPL